MKIQVRMKMDKETKGTVRYAEIGAEKKIGTIYIPKETLNEEENKTGSWPQTITVTVESVE